MAKAAVKTGKTDKADDKAGKDDKPKKSKLQLAKEKILKDHGAGSVMQGRASIGNVQVWSSEIADLDIVLGCGGVPRGRIMEVFGHESGGKTTTALSLIAACQHTDFPVAGSPGEVRKGVAAFIDAEHALDPAWATRLGVSMDDLIISQPDSGEQALDIAKQLSETGEVDIVVIDSVAALVPQAELDGEITDSNIGMQARLMSKAMRMLKGTCSTTGTTMVFINQIRDKIGVTYGSPETTPGGKALKFYASVRISIRGGAKIGKKDAPVGKEINITVIKNKVGPPFGKTKFDLMFDKDNDVWGVNKVKSLVDAAVTSKVIALSGSNYTYDPGNGSPVVKANGHAKLCDAIGELDDAAIALLREQTYKVILADGRGTPSEELSDEELADSLDDESESEEEEDEPEEFEEE